MVEIDKDYVFEGPDGKASLLDLFDGRRQLIVGHFMFDPSWDDGCPSCSAGADEIVRRPARAPARPRHDARLRLARAAREDRGLQGAQGLDVPLVLVVRQRLQLRLPRHARRVGRAGRVQLPRPRPSTSRRARATTSRASSRSSCPAAAASCATATASSTRTPTYARGAEMIGGSYYFLDLTALGRQEEWEEPKGRAARRARRGPRLRRVDAAPVSRPATRHDARAPRRRSRAGARSACRGRRRRTAARSPRGSGSAREGATPRSP